MTADDHSLEHILAEAMETRSAVLFAAASRYCRRFLRDGPDLIHNHDGTIDTGPNLAEAGWDLIAAAKAYAEAQQRWLESHEHGPHCRHRPEPE